jgi:hypothetical protein
MKILSTGGSTFTHFSTNSGVYLAPIGMEINSSGWIRIFHIRSNTNQTTIQDGAFTSSNERAENFYY